MSSPGHSGDEHTKLSPSRPTSNVKRNCNARSGAGLHRHILEPQAEFYVAFLEATLTLLEGREG
jgi:hypothetical protein